MTTAKSLRSAVRFRCGHVTLAYLVRVFHSETVTRFLELSSQERSHVARL